MRSEGGKKQKKREKYMEQKANGLMNRGEKGNNTRRRNILEKQIQD